jgi:alpha-beta hydrolase superfamily lysophospholipase
MVALTLPRLHWGEESATRKALVVHGLGSSAATTWQVSEALAEAGWSATAVDLRGHGLAPGPPAIASKTLQRTWPPPHLKAVGAGTW